MDAYVGYFIIVFRKDCVYLVTHPVFGGHPTLKQFHALRNPHI